MDAPVGFRPFYDPGMGVTYLWRNNPDGTYDIAAQQTVDDILDLNKAMANENDGYTPSRELRRAASIPHIVAIKWLREEGLDIYNPAHGDRLMRKLNDPDWAYLRTASGHFAPTQDGGFR